MGNARRSAMLFLMLILFTACASTGGGLPSGMATPTGVEFGDGAVLTAEVVGIDKVDRTLALLGPDGNVVAISVERL